MAVPDRTHPIWSQLIRGQKLVQFESLAIKIFLGRARSELSHHPTAANGLAEELYRIVVANETLPSVRKDLAKLGA